MIWRLMCLILGHDWQGVAFSMDVVHECCDRCGAERYHIIGDDSE
jgi:hypothetical protein